MPTRRPRALAVDDDALSRIIISRFLCMLGIDCDEACNGEVAVRMASERGYDVVIMDVLMPVMDGNEAAAAMKAGGIACPIVSYSAGDSELGPSFDASLPKPVTRDRLNSLLSELGLL